MGENEGYVGLLSFCSFTFSVMAAVLAIDLYALLRTGRSGSAWRVLVIASVIFALMHVLRLAELLRFSSFPITHLSEIVELVFVMALAYAFYLQRRAFGAGARSASPAGNADEALPDAEDDPEPDPDERPFESAAPQGPEDEEDAASEWARLNGQAEAAPARRGPE